MKLLGHSLSKTQTRAAIVSAAAGIALLVIAIAGMRKGSSAAATAPSDAALNTAFSQGYNTGATDAESKVVSSPPALVGPWDQMPSASPSAALVPSFMPDAPASTRSSIAAVDVAPLITIATGPAAAPAPAPSYPTAVALAREPIAGWTAPPMFQQVSPTVVVDTSGGKNRPGNTGAVNPANKFLGYSDPKTGNLSPTPNGGPAMWA